MELIEGMAKRIGTLLSIANPNMETTERKPKNFLPSASWRRRWLPFDEAVHNEVAKMIFEAEQFTKRVITDDMPPRLLVFAGRNGVGKSSVARKVIRAVQLLSVTAWHNGLCKHPAIAREYSWHALADADADRRRGETLWGECVAADCVLLDDIGAAVDRYKTGTEAENLRLMLEERRAKWTIVTTNIPPPNWSAAWDLRVADRLHRESIIVEIASAPSYRKNTYE